MAVHLHQWVFLVIAFVPIAKASTITFEAFPKELKANLSETASMRCSIHDDNNKRAASTATDVGHITSIFITRNDNEDVASVTSYDAPAALVDVGNMQAKGSLSAVSGEGFLELTWADPALLFLGDYQCNVAAVDTRGHIVQLDSNLELTEIQPSIMDVISAFNSKFQGQQKDTEILNHKLSNQQQVINNLTLDNTNQQKTITNLSNENTIQQRQLNNQQQVITNLSQYSSNQQHLITNLTTHISLLQQHDQKLTACVSPRLAYTARLATGHATYPDGQEVKYTDVLENIGSGYSPSTGSFTCSKPGLYLFNLHAQGDSGKEACLHLDHNGARVTHVWINADDGDRNAASASAVLGLKLGDVVKVVSSCTSHLYQGTNSHGNSFSGVLIQSDQCLP